MLWAYYKDFYFLSSINISRNKLNCNFSCNREYLMPVKVSIIIPAYNAEMFISNAINSVLSQNYSGEYEIIVVNDNSSDNTEAIVSEISNHYQQIINVPNERKKGPSGARNTGLIKAVGEYVAFLDADDLWLPNHLEEGIAFLEKQKSVDVVFFNFKVADYKTKRCITDWFSICDFVKKLKTEEIDKKYYLICDDLFNALLDESFIHLQSMIVRKKVLKNIYFNEEIKHSEDRDFSIQLYVKSKARFAFKNIITGIYFRHENSLTSKSIENAQSIALDQINLFLWYISNYSLDNLTVSKLKKMIYERYIVIIYCYRRLNKYRLAMASLFKSFKYKISLYQLKEFIKITISFVICNVFHYNK